MKYGISESPVTLGHVCVLIGSMERRLPTSWGGREA